MAAFENYPIFIDVGASDGRVWKKWMTIAPDARVFAFEPAPLNFNPMYNCRFDYPNVKMFQTAVSSVDNTETPFYISNDKNSSSLHPYNGESIRKWKYPPGRRLFKTDSVVNVPTMRLDTLIKKEHIRYVDYLKIDVQGHELEVLKGLGNSITKVREIQVAATLTPFDLHQGQTNQSDTIMKFMTDNAFTLFKQERLSRNQEVDYWFVNTRFSKILKNKFYHFSGDAPSP